MGGGRGRRMTTIHNNTNLAVKEAKALPLIMIVTSNWRKRDIEIREHPEHPERVITLGYTMLPPGEIIIADETRLEWARELATGRLHVTTE